MTDMPLDPYHPVNLLLKQREQVEAEFAAKLEVIDQAIAHLRGVELVAPTLPSPITTAVIEAPEPEPQLTTDSPYYGLGIPEAATKALSMSKDRKPMKPREITSVLLAAGVEIFKDDPVAAVRNGLMKREGRIGDVVLVGRGSWAMKEWYSEQELQDIRSSLDGKPTRDPELHAERVRKSMELARQRGVRIGREPFDVKYIQSGKVEAYQTLRKQGVLRNEALTQIGCPLPTYRKYQHVFEGVPEGSIVRRVKRKSTDALTAEDGQNLANIVHLRREQ